MGVIEDEVAYMNVLSDEWAPDLGIACPLTPKYLFMVRPGRDRSGVSHEEVQSEQVEQLNYMIEHEAEQFIVVGR